MAVYTNARNHLRDLYLLGRLRPDQQIEGPGGMSMPASQMFQELQGMKAHIGQTDELRTPNSELQRRRYTLRPDELNDPNGRAYLGAH